jgi:hypothetical protein
MSNGAFSATRAAAAIDHASSRRLDHVDAMERFDEAWLLLPCPGGCSVVA